MFLLVLKRKCNLNYYKRQEEEASYFRFCKYITLFKRKMENKNVYTGIMHLLKLFCFSHYLKIKLQFSTLLFYSFYSFQFYYQRTLMVVQLNVFILVQGLWSLPEIPKMRYGPSQNRVVS